MPALRGEIHPNRQKKIHDKVASLGEVLGVEATVLHPDEKNLIVMIETCRVQAARQRKGLPRFPCKSVGLVEFSVFARTIDPRIVTTCLSCPPETDTKTTYCSWQFALEEDD